MTRSPVPNPLLAIIVARALVRCGGFPDFSRGWSSCSGWTPSNERTAETWPAEWFGRQPALVRSQIDEALQSSAFRAAVGLEKPALPSSPDPAALADMLYARKKGPVAFSLSPTRPVEPVRAIGRPWSGAPSAAWIISARPSQAAWIELDPQEDWDPEVSRLCLRLGAGLWFHPPAKKLRHPDRCPSFQAALEEMLCVPGWDQWVFPLSDALEHSIARRLCPQAVQDWSGLPRLCKVASIQEWPWSVADTAMVGCFGVLVASIAWRMQQQFPDMFPLLTSNPGN